MRAYPHAVLNDEQVEWGAWRVVTADSSDVVPDHVKGWDYQQELRLQVDCHLNVSAACHSLGVTADELVLLATADCASTSRRFSGATRPDARAQLHETESDYEEWESWHGAAGRYYLGFWEEGGTWAVTDAADVVLDEADSRSGALESLRRIDADAPESWQRLTCDVRIPRESVANRLELSAQFIIRPSTSGGDHGVGARVLVGPARRIHLEGDGARFPTEPVSFAAMRWPKSLWRLGFSFDTPNDAYAGAVRLFVNVDHPGAAALLDPQLPGGDLARAFLRLDIVRTILTTLMRELRLTGGLGSLDITDESSVAGVADSLSREWLKCTLEEALLMAERSPDDFDATLQARALDLPKRVFS